MQRWEYGTLKLGEYASHRKALNKAGADGWELVTVVDRNDPELGRVTWLYFKRPIPGESDERTRPAHEHDRG